MAKKVKETEKKSRKVYTLDTKAEAKQMYLRGLYMREISVLLGVPVRTLEDWQTAEDWHSLKYPSEIRQKVYELRQSGMKATEIAKHFGLSVRAVYKYIRDVKRKAKESNEQTRKGSI